MTNRILSGLFLLSVTSTLILPAGAQTLSADEKELANYTLTMPTVRKVANAMSALNELESRDPKVRELEKIKKEIDALENKDELTDAEAEKIDQLRQRAEVLDEEIDRERPSTASTLADMEAQIKKHPEAVAILAKEGLTVRDFTRTTMALFQAAMVVGFSQGKVDMTKLPPGINPANVTFFQENQKELEEIQRRMEAASKK
jgi:hypothetical protein